MSELSYYSEVTKSCDQGPEHEIVYVNESIGNDDANVTYAFTNLGVAVRSSSALTMSISCGYGYLTVSPANGWRMERSDHPTYLATSRITYCRIDEAV